METKESGLSALWINFALAVLIAITACAGLFWPPTYARETRLWATEAMGFDAAGLVVIVPVLLVSAMLAHRGSVSARLVWMGTLIFLLYNFAIYAMAVHFNALFLVYCGGLGFSFYALVVNLPSLSPSEIAGRYGPRAPVKTVAVLLFLIAFGFAALWLGEIVPALVSGHAPKSVQDAGLFTSPVHVLDLSLLLPAFVIAAVMLLRRKPAAFILAPVLMVAGILIIVAVAGMVLAMAVRGFTIDARIAAFFLAPAAGLVLVLVRCLRV